MLTLKSFLDDGQRSKPVLVAGPLASRDKPFWPHANKEILWGWKRDTEGQSRAVYFSGRLELTKKGISVADSFFFYRHQTSQSAASILESHFKAAMNGITSLLARPQFEMKDSGKNQSILRFKIGTPRDEDLDRISRLLMRRPRKQLTGSSLPKEEAVASAILNQFPVDAYFGSGVSYEAGLPTLCEVHDFFCLDNRREAAFTFGIADELPAWLEKNPEVVLKNFCSLHTKALVAAPTPAQRIIAELWTKGLIKQVFSDNVDNLLCKVNVPFERTRGSGVFNERFPARFQTKTLLVVGVAADRRQIIQQARHNRMQIIVVDPCAKVSHGVQHLNYLRPGDLFFRLTADQFFAALPKTLR